MDDVVPLAVRQVMVSSEETDWEEILSQFPHPGGSIHLASPILSS